MALPIQRNAVTSVAIEVNREHRNPRNSLGAHQVLAAIAGHESTGDREVAIEPGGQQRPTIDLDAHLRPALRTEIWLRLQHEARRIGVAAEHAHGAARAYP